MLLTLTACSAPKVAATPIATAAPTTVVSTTPTSAPKVEPEAYPDPITGFFSSLHCEGDITIVGGAIKAWMETEAWGAEVEHIYATLRENASPALKSEWEIDLEELKENYLRFVSAEATAEAYLKCSDAFGDEAGNYGANINRGRLFSEVEAYARSELLEWHTKDWFETFSYPNYDPTVRYYQFDPQEAKSPLEEQGVPYTVEEYTVEPEWPARPDGGDNPIDPWTREQWNQSRTTLDMTSTSVLERDIWKAELLYIYDRLIALVTPNDEEPRKALEEARDALLAFAPDYGLCAALYEYSGAFIPESWKEHPDTLGAVGSLWGPGSTTRTGMCFRTMTLRLRDLWQWRCGDGLPWGFDPAGYESRLTEEAVR